MMTRKEVVRKAVHFDDAPRMPKFFFNGHKDSDIVMPVLEKWHLGEHKDRTEWGFHWQKTTHDESDMGVPSSYLLQNWDDFENYKKNIAPDPYLKGRFDVLKNFEVGDRYLMGSLFLTGFTTMWFLRGFTELLIDLYEAPEKVTALADLVFGFENEIIKQMHEYKFDCVALFDDWGMQKSMMISPELWRKYFFGYYKTQCDLAHSLGMDVFLHTCGYVYPIIGDLIEAGVDILNLGQADVNDITKLKEEFGGKVCFCQPINYQTTGISGTKEDIFKEAKEIMNTFQTEHGGLIPELFDYEKMGWNPDDPRNTEYQIQAFCGE
jgi:uroporphyrinogen decarboxylase